MELISFADRDKIFSSVEMELIILKIFSFDLFVGGAEMDSFVGENDLEIDFFFFFTLLTQ